MNAIFELTQGGTAAGTALPFVGHLLLKATALVRLGAHAHGDGRVGRPRRDADARRYVRGAATLRGGRSLIRVKTVNGDVRVHRGPAPGSRYERLRIF